MLAAFAEAVMSAEASMQCGAGYGERTDERTNSRNGYRHRPWDTRVGTIDLAVPKLRSGCTRRSFCSSPPPGGAGVDQRGVPSLRGGRVHAAGR